MQNEQTKSLLVNIMTGVVIIGVFAAGYFVFTSQNQNQVQIAATTISSVGEIASETALIGNEIESTVKDLDNLKRAVASSAIIFSTPAFQNLQDFSAQVPSESVGRTNPFTPTDWKLKMKVLENTIANASVPEAAPQTVPASPKTASSTDLLGGFPSGI